jgi:hypothetical protein
VNRFISEIQQPLLAHEGPRIEKTTRHAYDQIRRLNPSTMVAGLCGAGIDPYAVKLAWETPRKVAKTQAAQDGLDRGTLAHLMILEPHRVEEEVVIWHGTRRSGKDWEQFEAEHAGRLIMRAVDYAEVEVGARIASNNPDVRDVLAGCEIEMACLWREGSIACRGLVDAISKTTAHGTINMPDVKTTQRIDDRSAVRTVQDYHYREKMAMYRRCVAMARDVPKDSIRCYDIFVRIDPPYGVNIMQLSSDGLDWAEKRMLKVIAEVERCLDSGIWNPLVMRSQFGLTSWEEYEQGLLDMGDEDDDDGQ